MRFKRLMSSIPSYKQGYVTYSESEQPDLWEGCVLSFSPFLGITGNKIIDHSVFRQNGAVSGNNWTITRGFRALNCSGASQNIVGTDSNNYSFGDTVNDSPFSISCFFYLNTSGGVLDIFNKYSSTVNAFEYVLAIGPDDKVVFQIIDDIGGPGPPFRTRKWNTALNIGQLYYTVVTYDGRGGANAHLGMKIFIDGVRRDDTNINNGVYTAMHNTAQPVRIGRLENLRNSDGQIVTLNVWNRQLLLSETALLSKDPFIMFRPRDTLITSAILVAGRLLRYGDLNGLGGQGQMNWNPLG
jgi:hypothetical protein